MQELSDYDLDLGLLSYSDRLKIRSEGNERYIFDIIRKRYLAFQPEEFVRQLFIHWLLEDRKIPRNLIQLEKKIDINGLYRRFDLIVYDRQIHPLILIECKAPEIKITQDAFDQIAAYQTIIQAPYLIVTHGISSYIAEMSEGVEGYHFLNTVPTWSDIL